MKRGPFKRLLIANRGEIAVRIARAAREAGIESVAVYSDADRAAKHVAIADRAEAIGAAPARESYLSVERILEAARRSGAQAIHPGYGFLSENPALAEACEAAGLIFVGPPAAAIRSMGSKSEARRIALAAGVPVVPGYDGDEQTDARLLKEGKRIGLPLLVKPSAGGGGKGMRLVERAEELAEALAAARREAQAAFSDDHLILERFLRPVRHVEIQVFGDSTGQVVHLFERECSVQRRHQKIVEETPSVALDAGTRSAMGAAAVSLARAVGYRSAGTVEFVLLPDQSFYFLEMNTRLQVEHPVTECVTGLDLARWQLDEAQGRPIPISQSALSTHGHAIEVRLYAEDPEQDFLPAAGRLLRLRLPEGPGVRVDAGIAEGDTVGVHYDPLLAKIVAHAETRERCIDRLRTALGNTVVLGVTTNLDYLLRVLEHAAFRAGETYTDFVERHRGDFESGRALVDAPVEALALAALAGPANGVRARGSTNGSAEERPLHSPWTTLPDFRLGNGR